MIYSKLDRNQSKLTVCSSQGTVFSIWNLFRWFILFLSWRTMLIQLNLVDFVVSWKFFAIPDWLEIESVLFHKCSLTNLRKSFTFPQIYGKRCQITPMSTIYLIKKYSGEWFGTFILIWAKVKDSLSIRHL